MEVIKKSLYSDRYDIRIYDGEDLLETHREFPTLCSTENAQEQLQDHFGIEDENVVWL
jgi:hypothetical protein